jgi:hypothetical protein
MSTQQVANPLGLEVVYVSGVEAPHDAREADKLAEITASMEAGGWVGAPIVASRAMYERGQDRAYTGSHRIQAWRDAVGGELPCVFIEDIAETAGLDWDELMDDHRGDDWDAATAVAYAVPAAVREAYGMDIGGA